MNILDAALDDRLVTRTIRQLRKTADRIESVNGRSQGTARMRAEIARLEALLEYAGVRTRPAYEALFRDDSRN